MYIYRILQTLFVFNFLILQATSKFYLVPEPSEAILGQNFSLICSFDIQNSVVSFAMNGKTQCTVGLLNGTCFKTNCNQFGHNCSELSNTLTIPGKIIGDFHNTTWTCNFYFSGNNPSDQVKVIVKVPIKSVSLTPSSTGIPVGKVQTFTCTTDAGRPNARIEWYLSDGTNFTASASQQPDCGTACANVESRSVLEYTGQLDDHAKNIYCLASNVDDRSVISNRVTMTILYGPKSVVLLPSTPTYTVTETTGGIGPINCTADCIPNCTMTWSGPNLPGDTNSILNLQNMSRKQAGDYRCTATNSVGNLTSQKVAVTINYIPTIKSVDGNKTYAENDTAMFRCHVDSIPESTISWKFIDGGHETIISNENEPTIKVNDSLLTISWMKCLSMGLYICEATNSIGTTNTTINVTVMCAPKLNTIEYNFPERITVKDNQPLNITAPVLAFPKPSFYWQFIQNNSFTNITNAIQSTQSLNRHFSILYIENMTEDNFGTYALFAANGVGKNNYIGEFIVQAARRPNKPSHLNCSAGFNYIIVNWQPEFNGGSPQSFRVFYKIFQTEHFIGHRDNVSETKYHPVKIENLRSSVVYVLKVLAVNMYYIAVSNEIKCNTTNEGSSFTVSSVPEPQRSFSAGFGSGVALVVGINIIVIVAAFIWKRRRRILKEGSNVYEQTKYNTGDADMYNELSEISAVRQTPIDTGDRTYEDISGDTNKTPYINKRNMKGKTSKP